LVSKSKIPPKALVASLQVFDLVVEGIELSHSLLFFQLKIGVFYTRQGFLGNAYPVLTHGKFVLTP